MPFHAELTREAVLYERLGGRKTRCLACAHRCVTAPGGAGLCGVRFNEAGTLKAPWGYVSGAAQDPMEKKPFFHALPGARTLSFGMFGCNFRCDFCQNWQIADARRSGGSGTVKASPEGLAEQAAAAGAKALISTYNEPLITSEWAAAVFAEGKKKGIRAGFVSNGYATPEAVSFLRPVMDLWKIDLKSFNDASYRRVCGGQLAKVLDGIRLVREAGFWLEIVTLLVPGFNDSEAEISAMAAFIAGLSRDIPWHLTAFHPDHRMADAPPTPPETLYRAREAAAAKGLRYVYCGNIPAAEGQDTVCPACGRRVIVREGFSVRENLLDKSGACPCGVKIPGVWA